MRNRVFFLFAELPETPAVALVGYKHGIIAETAASVFFGCNPAIDPAFENFGFHTRKCKKPTRRKNAPCALCRQSRPTRRAAFPFPCQNPGSAHNAPNRRPGVRPARQHISRNHRPGRADRTVSKAHRLLTAHFPQRSHLSLLRREASAQQPKQPQYSAAPTFLRFL